MFEDEGGWRLAVSEETRIASSVRTNLRTADGGGESIGAEQLVLNACDTRPMKLRFTHSTMRGI